jgi:glycosyltransferase involved in cell wall biosynthesis
MERDKRVLFCSEASWLGTGYSVYTREVLSRLNRVDGLEVAELACYTDANNPNIQSTPWKVYPNKPLSSDPLFAAYSGNASAQFGDHSFNNVLLDFQPDVVIDIRDWWMIEYQQRSPFRDFFHWAIMPTVDAEPQDVQWINTFASADAVFTYSEFGRDTLLNQCDDIPYVNMASPAASDTFSPVPDKKQHKHNVGVSPDSFIVGTVMRNQKRKLYPDLFKSFRKFLDATDDNNVFLYCHTSYPDVGWNIPLLLDEHGLASRVLFTYKCKKCQAVSANFFQDTVQACNQCGDFSNVLVGVSNSISDEELSKVYNLFDIYVQYANSEGFGMPQLEAAHCGIPVISTYYSAMKSIVDNIGAIGIEPLSSYVECETGCNRAIPDNEKFVSELLRLHDQRNTLPSVGMELRTRAKRHYSWDRTASVWLDHIQTVAIKDARQTWLSPPKIFQPATQIPPHIESNVDRVNFLFSDVLHKPEWIGGHFWRKVLKDCTFGYRCENINKDFYFNENHTQSISGNQPFTWDTAREELNRFREQINQWERARAQLIQQGGIQ